MKTTLTRIETARDFAHTPHNKAEWRAALLDPAGLGGWPGCEGERSPSLQYLLDHCPYYTTIGAVRAAETRAKAKALKADKATYAKVMPTLEDILEIHERNRSAYFRNPPSNARGRRAYDEANSLSVTFTIQGSANVPVTYDIEASCTCSCKNIYYRLNVMVNGEKKNVSAIRRLLREGLMGVYT